jgi:Protein of unknown function (DUF3365)
MSANAEQEILDRARIMLETSRAMRTYTTTQKEFVGHRAPGGPEPFISAPIRVDDKSCLICHGVAARAPPKLVKLYGINNGFDWKLNNVVDAQIMGVPAPVAQNRVLAAQNTIMV